MSSRNNDALGVQRDGLYHIGIRCLAATRTMLKWRSGLLYHIGIRCLAATVFRQMFRIV